MDCACGCDESRSGPMGNTSSGMPIEDRQGRCFPVAYEYVRSLTRDDAVLVHGTVGRESEPSDDDIQHAWVVEADGWVWEPTNDAWFHSEEAFRNSFMHGRPIERWLPNEARNLHSEGRIGAWAPAADRERQGRDSAYGDGGIEKPSPK